MGIEEERLKEPEPVAEGRAAPSHEDDEQKKHEEERYLERKIEDAKKDAATAVAMAPDDPDARAVNDSLLGATANMNPQQIEQLARQARDKAAENFQKKAMSGLIGIAGLGMALQAMGVVTDGHNYPIALLGPDLPNNIAALPNRDRQGQELAI